MLQPARDKDTAITEYWLTEVKEQRGHLGWLLTTWAVNQRGSESRGHRLLFYYTFQQNGHFSYAEVIYLPLKFGIYVAGNYYNSLCSFC